MNYSIKKIFIGLFSLVPIFLITGPAIPDLVITFGIIYGLFFIYFFKNDIDFTNNFFIISIVFWSVLILISFFSVNKFKSFQDSFIFIRFLLIPIFLYFVYFKNDKDLKNLILIIFITVIIVITDTLFQFFNYTSKDGFGTDLLGFKSDWYGRLTGPFGDELVPGSYVSKFGLIGYIFLISFKKTKDIYFLHSVYLSLILIVCFASGERMALATYLLALLLLLFFLKGKRNAIIMSIILGMVSIFLIYKLHPFYNDYNIIESNEFHQGLKIEKIFKCENNPNKECTKQINIQPSFIKVISNFSTSAYGEIYSLALTMFKDNPITGVGISNFEYVCNNNNKYKKMMKNYNCASHPHNIYIQWISEGGIIVLLVFITYLYLLVKFIMKNKGDKELKLISIVILIILFWPIMSTGSLIKNWNGVLTFFIISICMCLSRLKISS